MEETLAYSRDSPGFQRRANVNNHIDRKGSPENLWVPNGICKPSIFVKISPIVFGCKECFQNSLLEFFILLQEFFVFLQKNSRAVFFKGFGHTSFSEFY